MKKAVSRLLICGLLFGLALQLLGSPSGYSKASSVSSTGSASPYSAEWRITGPTGGDVRALVVDPEDPNRFYFGTPDRQLYTPTDARQNWRRLFLLQLPSYCCALTIVRSRSQTRNYVTP